MWLDPISLSSRKTGLRGDDPEKKTISIHLHKQCPSLLDFPNGAENSKFSELLSERILYMTGMNIW